MKARISAAMATALVLGLSGVVQAKPISRIIAEMGLTPADFEVVNAASESLLSAGAPSVGQEEAWVNEDTGSKGTVRVQDVQDNCVILQHVVQPEGTGDTRDIRTRRCKTAEGNWVLAP